MNKITVKYENLLKNERDNRTNFMHPLTRKVRKEKSYLELMEELRFLRRAWFLNALEKAV